MHKKILKTANRQAFKSLRVTIIVLMISSCNRKTTGVFEEKIVSLVNKCPTRNSCQIRLRDVTTFDWEKGYALYHGTKAQRSYVLGTEDSGFIEGQRQIVFLKA